MGVTVHHRDWQVVAGDDEATLLPRARIAFDVGGCRGVTGYTPFGAGFVHTWFDGRGKRPFDVEAGSGETELICMLPQAGGFELDSPDSNLRISLRSGCPVLMLVPASRGRFRNPADQRIVNTSCHFSLSALAEHFDAPFAWRRRCQRAAAGCAFDSCSLELAGVHRLNSIGRELLIHPYGGRAAELFLESRMLEVAGIIVDALDTRKAHRRPYPWQRREVDRLDEARERLQLALSDPPGLDELAGQVGLGRNRLVAGFRERFGASPFEWLRRERLECARQALEQDSRPVSEIAADCGYAHLSSFSTAFEARYGCRPREWRRRQ